MRRSYFKNGGFLVTRMKLVKVADVPKGDIYSVYDLGFGRDLNPSPP